MLYDFLISAIIALKVIYLIDFFRYRLGWYSDKDFIKIQRESILFVSELLMYTLLIIYSFRQVKGHEKSIFILLGVIGIIQTLRESF